MSPGVATSWAGLLATLCVQSCAASVPGVDFGAFGAKNDRQQRVVEAFLHGWHGYQASCWGADELLPVARQCSTELGGLGAQIIDALDSLLLMGLRREYEEAREWLARNFTVAVDAKVSVFETTIRILGGLLSAYFLEGDALMLQHAQDLGKRLLLSWREGPLPYELVNLATGEVGEREPAFGSSLAEVGTLQVEFTSLSAATGDARFRCRAEHVMELLGSLLMEEGGLLPIMLRPTLPLKWTNHRVTLGGRGDSFYEYLLKQWLITNRTEERYRRWYRKAVAAIRRAFIGHSQPSNFTFVREVAHIRELGGLLGNEEAAWDPVRDAFAERFNQFAFILQVTEAEAPQPAAAATAAEGGLEEGGDPDGSDEQCEAESPGEEIPGQAAHGANGNLSGEVPTDEHADAAAASALSPGSGGGEEGLGPGHESGDGAAEAEADGTGSCAVEEEEEEPQEVAAGHEQCEVSTAAPATPPPQQSLVYVVVPPLPREGLCAVAELLLAGRWDRLHTRIQVALPQGSAVQLNGGLLAAIAASVGSHLTKQCAAGGAFKMDHLACFLPGLLALGSMTGGAEDPAADLGLAADLAAGCAHFWLGSPSGLAPESATWNVLPGREEDMTILKETAHSSLRPETVESLWYLYLATGDAKYQEWGWAIFEAMERHARVETGGFSGVEDVRESESPQRRDRMETFVLSETLKYLFLLFGDRQPFDLERLVLNTEGHPLPVVGA